MKLHRIPLPQSLNLSFGEIYSFCLVLDEDEEALLKKALPENLAAFVYEGGFNLYLNGSEHGFSFNAIEDLRIYYMKRAKGMGWVSLEATLVRTGETTVILQTDKYTEQGLQWFLENKRALEAILGRNIRVQDCGFDC